jgi:hypothetical protein
MAARAPNRRESAPTPGRSQIASGFTFRQRPGRAGFPRFLPSRRGLHGQNTQRAKPADLPVEHPTKSSFSKPTRRAIAGAPRAITTAQKTLGVTERAARPETFERVSDNVSLRFRETGFCGAETAASKRPVTFNRSLAETKPPHENPPIRRYLHDTGKSLFVWDCVVGLGGLELLTN